MMTGGALFGCALAGISVGCISGFLGIGGGSILAPLLVVALGMSQHEAQGATLAALVPPVGLPAVLAYRKAGVRLETKLVAALAVGLATGGPLGALIANAMAGRTLRLLFAGFLVATAVRALYVDRHDKQTGATEQVGQPSWRLALPVGILAGMSSGLFAVGGGLVAQPLLRRFGGMGRVQAQATAVAMMIPPVGLPAVLVYAHDQPFISWPLIAVLAVGFAGGAYVGAKKSGQLASRTVSQVYALVVCSLALLLVLKN